VLNEVDDRALGGDIRRQVGLDLSIGALTVEVLAVGINDIILLPLIDGGRGELVDRDTILVDSHIEGFRGTSDKNFHEFAVLEQVRVESLNELGNALAELVDLIVVDIDSDDTIEERVSLEVLSELELAREADVEEGVEGSDLFTVSVLNGAGSDGSDNGLEEGNGHNESVLVLGVGVGTDHSIVEFAVGDLVLLSESQSDVIRSADTELSVVSSLEILVLELVSQGVVEECFEERMSIEAELSHLIDRDLARSPSVESAPEGLDTESIEIDSAAVSTVISARESKVDAVDSVREEGSEADTRVVRDGTADLIAGQID
jgi:hypothetical protein